VAQTGQRPDLGFSVNSAGDNRAARDDPPT